MGEAGWGRMDIKRFQHFLAVVDAGSVSDAARALRMSQGALSISIQAIERDAGSALFIRSSDGMALNEVGRALEGRARLITNELDRAQREIRQLLGMERGRIVIGTAPHFAELILPRAIIEFQGAHPHVEICVIAGYLSTLASAVKTSVIDFGLATLSSHVIGDADLATKVLLPSRSARVYAAASNRLTARRRVLPRDLVAGPWLLPQKSNFYRGKFASLFEQAGLPAPQAAVEFESLSLARRLLIEGPYLSFFSKAVLNDEIELGLVKPVNVPELRWENDNATGAFFRKAGTLSPAALTLLDMIGKKARELDC
jgi:DNA-binding transcriptional LysR family regulator